MPLLCNVCPECILKPLKRSQLAERLVNQFHQSILETQHLAEPLDQNIVEEDEPLVDQNIVAADCLMDQDPNDLEAAKRLVDHQNQNVQEGEPLVEHHHQESSESEAETDQLSELESLFEGFYFCRNNCNFVDIVYD